jgi:sorbitol-6-phosphate 2-dehydrogenase
MSKVVLITGCSSGIGRDLAQRLAQAGYIVVATARNVETLADLPAALKLPLDVTQSESIQKAVACTLKRFGRIDVLVNNAGINIPRLLVDPAGKEELTDEIWDRVCNINQKGMFLCAQAVARQLLKQGGDGVIVNVASESGLEGSEGQSVYAATKAASYSLTRSWAKELGKHGIRVVGIAPGILEATALRSEEYERALAYTRSITIDQLRKGYEKVSIPLGRVGKLSEIASVTVFLASKQAGYISGTVLNVSGGKSRA